MPPPPKRAEDLLQRSVGNYIELKLDLARPVTRALVDDNQFDLALLNLVLNARDAMPDGGTITVAVDHRLSQDDPHAPTHGYVCLTVADDGQGMDEETLEKATQPFFTTEGTSSNGASLRSLITDFSMPKINGGQLAAAARQLFPDLPILLATGMRNRRRRTISGCRSCRSHISNITCKLKSRTS